MYDLEQLRVRALGTRGLRVVTDANHVANLHVMVVEVIVEHGRTEERLRSLFGLDRDLFLRSPPGLDGLDGKNLPTYRVAENHESNETSGYFRSIKLFRHLPVDVRLHFRSGRALLLRLLGGLPGPAPLRLLLLL